MCVGRGLRSRIKRFLWDFPYKEQISDWWRGNGVGNHHLSPVIPSLSICLNPSLMKAVNLLFGRIHMHTILGSSTSAGSPRSAWIPGYTSPLCMCPMEWLVKRTQGCRLPITLECRRTHDFALSQISEEPAIPKSFSRTSDDIKHGFG